MANIVQWPPAIGSLLDLRSAMRGGFELVQRRDSIQFSLKCGGEYAPAGVLRQDIAVKACQISWVKFCTKLPDGSFLYKLTTKAGGEYPEADKPKS